MTNTKKITLATVKSFMRKNAANLFVKTKSEFDGMVDCVMQNEGATFRACGNMFRENNQNTFGLPGVWFVGSGGSRQWCYAFNAEGFEGFSVSNCCGSFVVAVPAGKAKR
jgi:hypothetical protein